MQYSEVYMPYECILENLGYNFIVLNSYGILPLSPFLSVSLNTSLR